MAPIAPPFKRTDRHAGDARTQQDSTGFDSRWGWKWGRGSAIQQTSEFTLDEHFMLRTMGNRPGSARRCTTCCHPTFAQMGNCWKRMRNDVCRRPGGPSNGPRVLTAMRTTGMWIRCAVSRFKIGLRPRRARTTSARFSDQPTPSHAGPSLERAVTSDEKRLLTYFWMRRIRRTINITISTAWTWLGSSTLPQLLQQCADRAFKIIWQTVYIHRARWETKIYADWVTMRALPLLTLGVMHGTRHWRLIRLFSRRRDVTFPNQSSVDHNLTKEAQANKRTNEQTYYYRFYGLFAFNILVGHGTDLFSFPLEMRQWQWQRIFRASSESGDGGKFQGGETRYVIRHTMVV